MAPLPQEQVSPSALTSRFAAALRPRNDDPLLGCLLSDRFRILGLLGKGGMANVYRARDDRTGNVVALKLLDLADPDESLGEDPNVLAARFVREGTLHSRLHHPHIVQVMESGSLDEGFLYIAMECLEGQTLARLLQREGRLDLPRLFRLALQVCEAMQAVHREGVVHRDLKPGNVFLQSRPGEAEEVKLLDFGAGKWVGGDGKQVTMVGTVLGSPSAMSPEQIRGDDVDERTDIYAFGVLLYRCLTGVMPFRGDNTMEVIAGHLHRNPPPIQDVAPGLDVPADLEHIIFTCLAKDPARRFQDMEEVAWALRFAQAGAEGAIEDLEDITEQVEVVDEATLETAPYASEDLLSRATPLRKARVSEPCTDGFRWARLAC